MSDPYVVDKNKMIELLTSKGLTVGSTLNSEVLIYTYLTKTEFESTLKDGNTT